MSNGNAFRSKEQELERLVQEIADVKCAVREISVAVGRIERHVRRAFEIPKPSREKASKEKNLEGVETRGEAPTISPEEALKIFDDLSVLYGEGRGTVAEDMLQKMSIPDLRLLARELGVTFRSRPSKKSLCSGIIGRLNEKAMLSKNVNVTRPRTESSASGDPGEE